MRCLRRLHRRNATNGAWRVNCKTATRYLTRSSNSLRDPLLVSRGVNNLYKRRLYHLVFNGKAVLEDKTARDNIMKEASDIAIRTRVFVLG